MIRYDLNVYIGAAQKMERPVIKRHDTGITLALRPVVIRHVSKWSDEIECYPLQDVATAVLKIRKPDKTRVVTDVITIEGGRIVCLLPPQACAAPGVCRAEVNLFNAEGLRLTTATFEFFIDDECVCDSDPQSEDYFDLLSQQVKAANDAAKAAQEAAKRAENAGSGGGGGTGGGVDFTTDKTLTLDPETGVLSVNTTDKMEQDNTLPITSAAVYRTVGNIEALLGTI